MRSRMPSGSRLRSLTLLVLLTSLTTGCAGAIGSSDCRRLPLREYSQEEAAVITAQARAAPKELGQFVAEASMLRGAVRACKA